MIKYGYAYDPGATTGYAHFKLDTETRDVTILSTGVFTNYTQYGRHLQQNDRIVLYEIVRPCTKGFDPSGILSTGALLYVTEVLGIKPIGQYPHGIKGPRLWLKQENFKFHTEHEKDAVAHVLLYCTTHKFRFVMGK